MSGAPSLRRVLLLALLLMLVACAGQRPRVALDVAETALSARESVLFEQPKFSLRGRIGVSNGKDAGSGQFEWSQDGNQFDFTLTVTLTGDRYRLHGRPGRVTLIDAQGRSQEGFDAEALLAERTGWRIPVAQLGYWVRAMRAPGEEAVAQFGDDGLLKTLRQSRWQIDYRGWSKDRTPALPLKLQAVRDAHRVRVAIRQWS